MNKTKKHFVMFCKAKNVANTKTSQSYHDLGASPLYWGTIKVKDSSKFMYLKKTIQVLLSFVKIKYSSWRFATV